MKRIKRLTCTLAALAMVMWTFIPAQAEFGGTLAQDLPIMVEVISGSLNNIALTVYFLGRDLEVIDIATVPPAEVLQRNIPKPGKFVRRVIVDVDLPFFNSAATVRVTQGSFQFANAISSTRVGESFRFVFDVQ